MTDVIAVTDVGDLHAAKRAALFLKGKEIRKNLAWVGQVAQPVDDRDRRMSGQLLHGPVGEGSRDNPINPSIEILRHILDGFPYSKLDLGGRQIDGTAAQLGHSDLKGDSSPERWLLEYHAQRLASEQWVGDPLVLLRLQVGSKVKQAIHLRGRQVTDRQKVFRHRGSSARTRSRICIASSTSASPMSSGGTKRRTWSPAVKISRPRFRHRSTIDLAGTVSSMASISPRPLTSFTKGYRVANSRRRSRKYAPILAARSGNCAPRISVSTAWATVVMNGLPPKVDAWLPGTKASATPSFASMAPIGNPPPSPLASVMMSGSIPECS